MLRTESVHNYRHFVAAIMSFACLLGWSGYSLASVPDGSVKIENAVAESVDLKEEGAGSDALLKSTFCYVRENRADPFMPFVSLETIPEQVEEEENVLSGMQLFEPGQLNLVTILFSGDKAVAMVQDSTGMGHVIQKKDKIGRRGVVKDVLHNVVVIEEWYLNTSGMKKYKTIEMVLRKEGDK